MANDEKSGDVSTAALGLLVELLAAREQANTMREELAPWVRKVVDPFGVWRDLAGGVTTAEVRNLAFEVARIQIQSLRDLTRQGENLSKKIVQRLQEAKRPVPARPGEEQLLVCNLEGAATEYHGDFVAPANVARFPQALVLRPLEGGAEFPVAATFFPAQDAKTGDRVRVTVAADAWIQRDKHYQARLPLAGTNVVVWFKLVGR